MKNVFKEFMNKLTERINFWLHVSRYFSLPQTIIPYILAVVLASKHYKIDCFLSILGLIGVVLAHLGVNILDDYFDWKKGAVEARKKLIDGGMRARSHKCYYLENNSTTLGAILTVALSMCAVAVGIGLFIALKVGVAVLVIAGITGFLGFFYAAPPIRLSYHGLGEIAVGIIFGPLLMAGAYITAGGRIDMPLILASLIVGIFVLNILHTHCIMDFEPDKNVGRISLAVLLKTPQNALIAQKVMLVLVYIIMAIGIIIKAFPPLSILTFLTLPIAFEFIKLMTTEDRQRKYWMGPMENWKNFQKEGLDYFMLRWYLSRNLLTDFIIILGVTYLIG